jgi:hypothetical protein
MVWLRQRREATLNGRPLCRNHSYDMAARRLEEFRALLKQVEPAGAERNAILKFLSEVINHDDFTQRNRCDEEKALMARAAGWH